MSMLFIPPKDTCCFYTLRSITIMSLTPYYIIFYIEKAKTFVLFGNFFAEEILSMVKNFCKGYNFD